ncbi:putative porin [Sphingobacterium yanglingense]|uniref:Putative beta-barrel porin n=1 Tax=Sphingobacterium yanglingense TaxID=1437280 RepID=A0A4V3DD91_9SPHI|nr:putative porin [Sphingobacterium yanglingense]TDQ75361.1 putative beta-barrel porin [Sphingobacterium yanglingense]
MNSSLRSVFIVLMFLAFSFRGVAQEEEGFSSALDSARALEDNKKDSVVFSAKYVRYATLDMLKYATYTKQIDTTHHNFQYFNKQNLPWNPSINLGSYGLATRDLLFTPDKRIGFQPGFHGLERYLITSDSVNYYRARARYSELYAVGFFFDDQVFRAKLAQNINPQWNIGAEYHAANTEGYYMNQNYADRKGAVFSWYESPSKRYNMLTNFTFNKLDATENGSVTNDSLFRDPKVGALYSVPVRLTGQQKNRPYTKWTDYGLFLRQSYYLGRLDTLHKGQPEMEIHPTNAIAHNSSFRQRKYTFFKNETDRNEAFPFGNAELVNDTTSITTISNEFTYSFYLRNKSLLKNEAKLNLGFQNDLIWYKDSLTSDFFQNSTIKGELTYKFSDRIDVRVSGDQIVVGKNFGDFLYEANADIAMGDKIGVISLGAYTQNKSPEMVFNRMNYTYHQWSHDFDKTKTQNLSFMYSNKVLGFSGKVEYFLMNKYLYFKEVDNPENNERLDRLIEPTQSGNLNLLKVTAAQKFKFGEFTLDNKVVYQKSDAMAVLMTPELYTWHSLYYSGFWYNVLDFRIGTDVRFNTPFRSPSYAINAGQFYYDNTGIEFSTYPIVDFWITANIQRVNLFISSNFTNQYIAPKGYYTVRRYPMNPANFRFGVSWKFYD